MKKLLSIVQSCNMLSGNISVTLCVMKVMSDIINVTNKNRWKHPFHLTIIPHVFKREEFE